MCHPLPLPGLTEHRALLARPFSKREGAELNAVSSPATTAMVARTAPYWAATYGQSSRRGRPRDRFVRHHHGSSPQLCDVHQPIIATAAAQRKHLGRQTACSHLTCFVRSAFCWLVCTRPRQRPRVSTDLTL